METNKDRKKGELRRRIAELDHRIFQGDLVVEILQDIVEML